MKKSTLVRGLSAIAVLLALYLALNTTGLLVPEEKAIKALETQGFSNIKITDRSWFLIGFRGGDRSDCVRFTATATNAAGKEVTVYVFSGWIFKGATIRTP